MTHADMEDLYELYTLDLLDHEEASEIDSHLAEQCEVCMARVRSAARLTSAFSSFSPKVNPPAALRERVLSIAKKSRTPSLVWAYAFAAAAVAAFLIFGWGYQQFTARNTMAGQMATLRLERNALHSAVAILSESDMKTVQFGANQEPHGRVFVSAAGGVVFVGSQLPELAAEHTFELWLIPRQGNPQAAGVFVANAAGVSVNVLSKAIDTASIAAVAVSIEPTAGSPQPTTKPILIIPVA